MEERVAARLRSARALYIRHYRYNHTPMRERMLAFWNRECLRLRKELENLIKERKNAEREI